VFLAIFIHLLFFLIRVFARLFKIESVKDYYREEKKVFYYGDSEDKMKLNAE
jgi:hypothetical protein